MPALITLEEAKLQIGMFADETADDAYLNSLIEVASEVVERDLNRKLYTDQAELDADSEAPDYAMPINNTVKMACKFLVGHWYNNRESTSELTIKEVPQTYGFLIDKYRIPVA